MVKPSIDKSAKKLASKGAKAATKVAAIKEKKIVSAVIKDTHMGGFVNFIREQGVVGMAVGLAIGTAAGDTVKKLVTAFIDPLVQLVVGSQQGFANQLRSQLKLLDVKVSFYTVRLLAR